jgi:rod shape determining protein RodA
LNPRHPFGFGEKDVLNLVIGLGVAALATVLEYRAVRAAAPAVYGLACLGLAATFVIGTTVNGSLSWIAIGGGFEIQPSEFAKIAVIVVVAMLFSERREGITGPRDRDVIKALLILAIPMLMIVLEPDIGNALVLTAITFGVLAVGPVPTRWLLALTATLVAGIALIINGHILHSYQQQRLTAFTHPNAGRTTIGFNAYEARLAIGSGGIHGTGLFHGPLINAGLVFAAHTDFVFATAGEELGFLGCALIIALLAGVLWRGWRIAANAPDRFGRIVATGVMCWFAFESFENIGMNLGIMPITGIPLPFVSYGGSSMFANMVAVGLLQNVHIHSKQAGSGI